jgi:chloramphenicol-sensitive protein RarD
MHINRGILFGIGAYLLWGLFPLYWKALQSVPATQILGHRIVWSFAFLLILVVLMKSWASLRAIFKLPYTLVILAIAAVLLGSNWLVYIWGVNAGFIVETSLGYFINPLVNVLLGVLFLRERLRTFQWLPVGLAAIGVLYLTLSIGKVPWISLYLAITFGLYGLLKKLAAVGSVPGLTVETGVLLLPSLGFLIYTNFAGSGALGSSTPWVTFLLVGSGVVTALPLLLFSAAARAIPLTTLGLLQYMAPTMQLLIGVLVYREPFDLTRLIGFSLIWIALILYTLEGFAMRKRLPSLAPKDQPAKAP